MLRLLQACGRRRCKGLRLHGRLLWDLHLDRCLRLLLLHRRGLLLAACRVPIRQRGCLPMCIACEGTNMLRPFASCGTCRSCIPINCDGSREHSHMLWQQLLSLSNCQSVCKLHFLQQVMHSVLMCHTILTWLCSSQALDQL